MISHLTLVIRTRTTSKAYISFPTSTTWTGCHRYIAILSRATFRIMNFLGFICDSRHLLHKLHSHYLLATSWLINSLRHQERCFHRVIGLFLPFQTFDFNFRNIGSSHLVPVFVILLSVLILISWHFVCLL